MWKTEIETEIHIACKCSVNLYGVQLERKKLMEIIKWEMKIERIDVLRKGGGRRKKPWAEWWKENNKRGQETLKCQQGHS